MGDLDKRVADRVPVLETDRLALHRLTTGDAEFIVSLLNEPTFIRNVGDKGVRSVDDACRYIADGPAASYAQHGFGLYLVALKETGAPIGICGLRKRDALEDVDIGFALLPEFRARGFALEAARAVKEYARQVIGLTRLVAITVPDNTRSIRVLEKLGFRFERQVRLSDDDAELALFASHL